MYLLSNYTVLDLEINQRISHNKLSIARLKERHKENKPSIFQDFKDVIFAGK